MPWEHFVGFFIRFDRRALHYRGPAGTSLEIILRERQRDVIPREASQRGETSWNVNAKSSGASIVDASNLFAKIKPVHIPGKMLAFCVSLRRHYNVISAYLR